MTDLTKLTLADARDGLAKGDYTSVELTVYDLLGRRVRTLFTGVLPAGEHRYTWDGRGDNGITAGSGSYFVELRQGEKRQAQKMTLLK